MSNKMELRLCVLWEHELREAAKLLKQLETADDNTFPGMARDALNACIAALYHLDDDSNVAIVSAATLATQVKIKVPKT